MPNAELAARVYEPGDYVRTHYLTAHQTATKDDETVTCTAYVQLLNGSHLIQSRPTARHTTGQGQEKEEHQPTKQTQSKTDNHNLGNKKQESATA